MRANEFTIVEKKKRKRKLKGAAWGPGPYGGYGYASGYSGSVGGDGGAGGTGGAGVGENIEEAPYPGNIGIMELSKFFQIADDQKKKLFKKLVEKGKKGLAWKLVQDTVNVKLQGKEFEVDEDWRHWVAGLGAASALAGGGGAAYDAYKASQAEKEPTAVVAKADKSYLKKGIEKIAKDAVPKQTVTGSPHEKFLTSAAVAAGIKGEELAQFLAQTAHESHNFKSMIEYGDSKYFNKYEPKFAKDKKTKKTILDPKTKKPKNFNSTAAILGNDMPGDGEKYKGRGYIQLTGKYNYDKAGKALGLDLVKNPQLVEKPEVAAKVAVWFWQNRVQPKVDDFSNTKAVTKPINKGLKGLEDRKEKFQDFKVAMK